MRVSSRRRCWSKRRYLHLRPAPGRPKAGAHKANGRVEPGHFCTLSEGGSRTREPGAHIPPPMSFFMPPMRFIIFIMPPPLIFFIIDCIWSN